MFMQVPVKAPLGLCQSMGLALSVLCILHVCVYLCVWSTWSVSLLARPANGRASATAITLGQEKPPGLWLGGESPVSQRLPDSSTALIVPILGHVIPTNEGKSEAGVQGCGSREAHTFQP